MSPSPTWLDLHLLHRGSALKKHRTQRRWRVESLILTDAFRFNSSFSIVASVSRGALCLDHSLVAHAVNGWTAWSCAHLHLPAKFWWCLKLTNDKISHRLHAAKALGTLALDHLRSTNLQSSLHTLTNPHPNQTHSNLCKPHQKQLNPSSIRKKNSKFQFLPEWIVGSSSVSWAIQTLETLQWPASMGATFRSFRKLGTIMNIVPNRLSKISTSNFQHILNKAGTGCLWLFCKACLLLGKMNDYL